MCFGCFVVRLGDPMSGGWKSGRIFCLKFLFQEQSRHYFTKMFNILPNSMRRRTAHPELANPGTCAIWCDMLTAVGIQGHMQLPFPLEHCNYCGHKGVSKEKKLTHYTYKLYSQVPKWLIKLSVNNSSSCGIIFHKWNTPTNRRVIEYIYWKSTGDNSGNYLIIVVFQAESRRKILSELPARDTTMWGLFLLVLILFMFHI